MKKVEVYILSGFLGSGKTTLLKRLLQNEQQIGRKTAVIMNELGSVSIDSNAVEEDVTLKELLGGCICCSMQDQFEVQLHNLLLNEQLDVIYIETTGAAHPVEVLDAVLSPLIADKLIVKGVITTVDGLRWVNRKLLGPQLQQLLIEQIRYADYILINKIDELTEEEQAKASFEIQSLNSKAPCLLTTHSKVSIDKLRNLIISLDYESKHISHTNHIHLTAFVYQFHTSISQLKFEKFIQSMPETIYRMKGYILFEQSEYPVMFQYSYGMPIYMKEYMNYPLNLVLIGEHIDWETVALQLRLLEE